MKSFEKVSAVVVVVLFIFVAGYALHTTAPTLGAGAYNRNAFPNVFASTIYTVTSSGVIVVASSSYNPGTPEYLSIVNSGSAGVSCFPIDFVNGTESTSSLTYGGGWYLVGSGGAISLDSAAIYGGTVWCVSGATSSTVGVVAR